MTLNEILASIKVEWPVFGWEIVEVKNYNFIWSLILTQKSNDLSEKVREVEDVVWHFLGLLAILDLK